VAQELLHRPIIVTSSRQVGGEAVPEDVAARQLTDPCLLHCLVRRPLKLFLAQGDAAAPITLTTVAISR
jgi:hypothetical protein